ncbi:hypothetical protein SAMN04487969_101660 [Paenibacillus algorifonticola]|uniref:Beta-carotene 15,15'-monooxygenase n=1 Tax=Paenibacillus algorifonticola TaxID=684063 RepID=A0A1I1YN99_9BACL|nr:hypothetical protein [Paenibacillus algorifonticola]SFE21001.1 hypothetical protein SAMN04487969_101660 [Paenibacillus algorifonticola]
MRYSDDLVKKHEHKGGVRNGGAILFIVMTVLLAGGLFFFLRQMDVGAYTINASIVTVIVLIPLLFYFLCMKSGSRPKEFVYVVFVVSVGLVYWLTPVEQRGFLQSILRWMVPVLEIILVPYLIYRIYTIVKRYKAVDRKEQLQPIDIMREALLPVLGNGVVLEIVLSEMSVFYYSLVVWFKKPKMPESGYYTYHKESQVKMTVIVFVILIALEAIGLHFLLSRWNEVLAWILLVLNVYGILYMIALHNSVRYLPITLNEDHLAIRLGFQSSIVIPISSIESIGKAKGLNFGDKVSKDTYLAYMRVDDPQFEIRLKQQIPMRGSYGIMKNIMVVVVRVDIPHEFSAELERLINREQA